MEKEIELLDHQMQFMQSNKPCTIMIAGRGSGKSYVAGMKSATLLLNGFNVLGIAQNYKMTKKVLFRSVEDALNIIGVPFEKNIGDLTIKVNNATLYGFSAENKDGPRGLTNIKALILDEAALAPKELYDVACACLRGQGPPESYLITTPRGRGNWINTMIKDPDNNVIHATTYDNTYLDDLFVKNLEKIYDSDFAKQELIGEVLDTDEPNQFISSALLNSSIGISTETNKNDKIVFGVDVARFGSDKTVIYVRVGKNIVDREALDKSDTFDIVNLVEKYERKYGRDNVDQINIDCSGGYGAGPYDVLSKSRKNVVACEFGGKSPDEHLSNFRTYLYQNVVTYLKNGGKVGYRTELDEELVAQEYIINSKGKKACVPKDNVKQKLGRSCDDSDSFALCVHCDGDMFKKTDKVLQEIKNDMFAYKFKSIGKKAGFVND